MEFTVSVIIPTWNRAATIEAAIKGALNQTHPPLEILVCDDGSTDQTKDLVAAIEDERVLWIAGEHAGRPAIPRNRGIRESRGEWLAFLDSDDEWLPEKLERQTALAELTACLAVCANAYRVDPEGCRRLYQSWQGERITFSDFLQGNKVICTSAIIHRSLVAAIGGFPESLELTALEDYALWLRVATQTDFAYVDEPLVLYRDDPDASLRKQDVDGRTERSIVLEDLVRWANDRTSARRSFGQYESQLLSWRARRAGITLARKRTRNSSLRILHTVESYFPSVGGMQEVVRQLSERLAKRGHQVTVATTGLAERTEDELNGVTIAQFDISGKLATGLHGETESYQDFLLNADFDIVTNFAAQQWATDLALPLLDQIRAKKVFVPTGFSGLYDPQFTDYFGSMKSWMEKYDVNIFLSEDYRDINFARQKGIQNITVIPNGADAEEFLPNSNIDIRKELGIPADHFLILHVGSHTSGKGHAEAVEIFRRARIRNATLLIIGNAVPWAGCIGSCERAARDFNRGLKRRIDHKRLLLASLPRQKTIAAYKAADLFLFPSNIECSPLVLFECMAAKTPFLTTNVGNAAEIIEWSGAGELLPTRIDANGLSVAEIEPSVALLNRIYQEPGEREKMRTAGFEAWQQKFTWQQIATAYESLYLELLEN